MKARQGPILVLLAACTALLPSAACGDDVDGGSSQGGTASGTSGSTTGGATTDTTGTGAPTTTGTSGTGSDGTTGAPATTGGPGTTGGTSSGPTDPPPNDCCIPHRTPGCADSQVEACVCGADLTCCVPSHGWDEICVKEVTTFGCGRCERIRPD